MGKKLKARERIGIPATLIRNTLVASGWTLSHAHHAATGSDYLFFSHPRSIQIRIADHGGGFVPGTGQLTLPALLHSSRACWRGSHQFLCDRLDIIPMLCYNTNDASIWQISEGISLLAK